MWIKVDTNAWWRSDGTVMSKCGYPCFFRVLVPGNPPDGYVIDRIRDPEKAMARVDRKHPIPTAS